MSRAALLLMHQPPAGRRSNSLTVGDLNIWVNDSAPYNAEKLVSLLPCRCTVYYKNKEGTLYSCWGYVQIANRSYSIQSDTNYDEIKIKVDGTIGVHDGLENPALHIRKNNILLVSQTLNRVSAQVSNVVMEANRDEHDIHVGGHNYTQIGPLKIHFTGNLIY